MGRSLAAFAMAMLLAATPALGGGVLDQSQEQTSGGAAVHDTNTLGQTFKPSITQQLDHVDLLVSDGFGFDVTYPTDVAIVETIVGVPSGGVLGEVLDVVSWTVGWNSVDFLGENLVLNAGTLYGIVVSNDDPDFQTTPTWAWCVEWHNDPYAAGAFWSKKPFVGWQLLDPNDLTPDSDAAFRTYMVPEPLSVSLLGIGACLALLRRRRR